jgi:hypothetical protein
MALDLSFVVPIYQENIDALIDQLGKNITAYIGEVSTDCPNCDYDPVRKASSGRYTSGGPIPFVNGTTCPYCSGKGKTITNVTSSFKGLVKWNPRDFNRLDLQINESENICRLKTFLSDIPNLMRAKYIVIDTAAQGTLGNKMYLLRKPIPIGLQESRYAVSYWREGSNA